MRGVNFWRGACLAVCLCVAASAAMGQSEVTVGSGGMFPTLTAAVLGLASHIATDLTITLLGDGPFDAALLELDWLAGKSLKIRAEFPGAPQNVVIQGISATALFTVPTSGTLIFEDVTIQPDLGRGVLVSPAARLEMNRCLLQNAGAEGIKVLGGEVLIANSCFSNTALPAVSVDGGSLFVAQSTFIDCRGDGIAVTAGSAEVVLSLFHNNRGAGVRALAGNASARFCTFSENDLAAVGNITSTVDATVKLATTRLWPGDLSEGIEAPGNPAYPAQLAKYDGFDFENQARNAGRRQVGADEEGGGTVTEIWLDTEYEYNLTDTVASGYGDGLIYVGNGGKVQIDIVGNTTNLDFAGDSVRIVPAMGDLASGQFIEVPLVRTEIEGVGRAEFVVTGSVVNGVVMDGLATVHLVVRDGSTGEQVFGLQANQDPARVRQAALDNSQVLFIDTMAPELILDQTVAANALLESSSDTLSPNMGDSNFPDDWRPGFVAVPYNKGALRQSTQNEPAPKLFFNGIDPLSIGIRATFRDVPPEGSGAPVSGFDSRLVSVTGGTVETVLIPVAPTVDEPAPLAIPYWAGNLTGALELTNPAEATYELGPQDMTVVWRVLDIPPRADGSYWRMSLIPVARDRARNVTNTADLNALELWWMQYARAEITSRFNGAAVPVARVTWALSRPGDAPSNASPCDPLFRYRIWVADRAGGWQNASWQAVGPWSDWVRDTGVVVPNSIINTTLNRRLLVTVAGADEAGNVHAAGITEEDTFEGVRALEENGVPYDHWLNMGLTGTVDTTLSARIWHYDTALDEPEAFMRDFGGSGARVPDPNSNRIIVLGQFDVNVVASQTAVRRVIIEISGTTDDGASAPVASGSAELAVGAGGQVTVFIAEDKQNAAFALPQGASSVTYLVRAWAEMDVTAPGGDTVTVIDDSPATLSFTVYDVTVPTGQTQTSGFEERTDEQPFKVYVRGE